MIRCAPGMRPAFARNLRLEPLEDRSMLSLPTVVDVNVAGTDWTADFVDYLESEGLGTDGYSIPVGSSSQTTTLPWINIDQIRITFSEDVDIQQGDLSLSGVNTTAYAFSAFAYDSASKTATWTLDAPVGPDKLLIDLDADGIDPMIDTDEGNVLDGEWTDESSTYPSGDGSAGGDFEFAFNVVDGDADGNNGVNIGDAGQIGNRIGAQAGDAEYGIRHDIDADGDIDWDDFYAARDRIGNVLPSGDPAGINNDAPTTSGLADVAVDEDAADYVLYLWGAFDDAEDGYGGLSFEIVENTNPALFDSTEIDNLTGELTLDFAENAFGQAEITVRATDTGGLFVETTFTVDVAPVNDAPVISEFVGVDGPGDYWTFSGVVTDVDDVVEGMIVVFGGVLEPYNVTTVVRADGTFSLSDEFPGLESGLASAQTEDDDGALSNLALYEVSVT